jgi:hypothetical protein
MPYRVEFLRAEKVVGGAPYPDLASAIRHARDLNVFHRRYAATVAQVFDVDKRRLVYRYTDTTPASKDF